MAFLLPTLISSGLGLLGGLFQGWGAQKQSAQDRKLMEMYGQKRTELQQTLDQRRAELQSFIATNLMNSNTSGLEAQANRSFDRAKATMGSSLAASGSSESGNNQALLNAQRGNILADLSGAINQDQYARSSAAAGLTSQFDMNSANTLSQFDQGMMNSDAARTPDVGWFDILMSGLGGGANGAASILPFLDLPGMNGQQLQQNRTPQQGGSQNGYRSQRY